MRERKAKRTAYLTKETNRSHDKRSSHMSINKRSETDLRTIKERTIGNRSKERSKKEQLETDLRTIRKRTIGNRSKNDQRKSDQKSIGTEP